ncbi:MAG: AbrB/MazE/SpoVT family DNA-binding domain-containing protein [Candidatus Bathyarchaeia archaeon]
MVVSRVGKRFTVVIPQEVRAKVPVKEGEPIVWEVEGERIIIKPTSFKRIAGIVKSGRIPTRGEVSQALEKELERDLAEAVEA